MKTAIQMTWDGITLSGDEDLARIIARYPMEPDGSGWTILSNGSGFVCVGIRRAAMRPNGRGQITVDGFRNCPCARTSGVNADGNKVEFLLVFTADMPDSRKPWEAEKPAPKPAPVEKPVECVKYPAPFPFSLETVEEDLPAYIAAGIGDERTGAETPIKAGWSKTPIPNHQHPLRVAGAALFSLIYAARNGKRGEDLKPRYDEAALRVDFTEI